MKRTCLPIAIAATFALSASALAGGDKHRSESYPQGMYSQNMSNDTVRQVQQALQDNGHNAGPIDGILGPITASALRDFQRAQGLDVTGRIDQQTLASLGVSGASSFDRTSSSSVYPEHSPGT